MSHYDYIVGRDIAQHDYPFYALIQAAMRQADTRNAVLLAAAFPAVHEELTARRDAPGGLLDGEQ